MARATASKLLGDFFNMVGPLLQCLAYCVDHFAAIVDASDARLMAAYVVERLLHDMREYTKLCHAGGCRSPKIVDAPRRNAYPLV